MVKHFPVILVVLVGTTSLCAQVVVNSVANAASYLVPPAPSSTTTGTPPIAQGSLMVIQGSGLGPSSLVVVAAFPLQTSLPAANGTSVSVASGGQTVSAFMYYTVASQVAAILPSATPTGPATLTVTYNGQTSKAFNIFVTKSVPGIFTQNAAGNGPVSAHVVFSATDFRLNNLTTPGTPGASMVLYGTGLGPTSDSDSAPPTATPVDLKSSVTVTIGGKSALVQYAGRAGYFPGVDQIFIQVPADVPLGCYTPGVVAINGIPSNDFTISTAAAGSTSCVHPFGLNQAAEAKVDAGGSVNAGVFAAVRGAVPPITAEGAGGLFGNLNGSQLFTAYTSILTNFHVIYYPAAVGGCAVYDELSGASSGQPIPSDFTNIGGTELMPASFLTLSGPNNVSQGILRAGGGGPGSGYLWVNLLGAASSAELGTGAFTLTGTAGPDIAAFSATTQFPPNLSWSSVSNSPTASFGVTMTWTGGGTPAQPNVNIFGNSSVFNNADPSKNRGKSFSCIVPASSSPFAVPASITGQLPVAGAGETPEGSLGMSIGGGSQFNATLANGTPLDGTFFGFGEAFVNTAITWK